MDRSFSGAQAKQKRRDEVFVHGHTISRTPEVRPNRIGIDTGAFATRVLTKG